MDVRPEGTTPKPSRCGAEVVIELPPFGSAPDDDDGNDGATKLPMVARKKRRPPRDLSHLRAKEAPPSSPKRFRTYSKANPYNNVHLRPGTESVFSEWDDGGGGDEAHPQVYSIKTLADAARCGANDERRFLGLSGETSLDGKPRGDGGLPFGTGGRRVCAVRVPNILLASQDEKFMSWFDLLRAHVGTDKLQVGCGTPPKLLFKTGELSELAKAAVATMKRKEADTPSTSDVVTASECNAETKLPASPRPDETNVQERVPESTSRAVSVKKPEGGGQDDARTAPKMRFFRFVPKPSRIPTKVTKPQRTAANCLRDNGRPVTIDVSPSTCVRIKQEPPSDDDRCVDLGTSQGARPRHHKEASERATDTDAEESDVANVTYVPVTEWMMDIDVKQEPPDDDDAPADGHWCVDAAANDAHNGLVVIKQEPPSDEEDADLGLQCGFHQEGPADDDDHGGGKKYFDVVRLAELHGGTASPDEDLMIQSYRNLLKYRMSASERNMQTSFIWQRQPGQRYASKTYSKDAPQPTGSACRTYSKTSPYAEPRADPRPPEPGEVVRATGRPCGDGATQVKYDLTDKVNARTHMTPVEGGTQLPEQADTSDADVTLAEVRPEADRSAPVDPDEQIFLCGMCGKSFCSERFCKKHVKAFHKGQQFVIMPASQVFATVDEPSS